MASVFSVFISYDRDSRALAITLAADIESLGHTAWFDQEISGGLAWWDQILAQVRECDVFLFVLNPETLDSVACKSEYLYAAALGKAILPVLVSDQVAMDLLPPALSLIQFVDYRTTDRDAAFRLARALNSIPPSQPLPESLPTPPPAPISYLGTLAERVDSISLSYEEQGALLADLKVTLRDQGVTDHIQELLATLRKRRDLFATFADEIDDLIAKSGKLRPNRVVVQQPDLASPNALDPSLLPTLSAVKEVDSVRVALRRLLWPETRLWAALRGAIFGSVVVVLYLGLAGVYSSEPFFFKFVTLLAIAGAILGKKGWASLVACLLVVGIWSLGTALQKPAYESAIGSGAIVVVFAILSQVCSWIYALIARRL
jgi:TIR domain